MSDTQTCIDKFYFESGKCCAGCDHWRHFNAVYGECIKSANERFTNRSQDCGDFIDEFDWDSLDKKYLQLIGYKKCQNT